MYQIQLSVIVGSTPGACIRGAAVVVARRKAIFRPEHERFRGQAGGDEVAFECSDTGGDKRHVT